MQYRPLGRTGLKVSQICLGTMTWGHQNSEAEAHAQMDYALDRGINFWDTAEMYPVPPVAPTYGRTEEIIGSWLASRKRRGDVILATKVAGPDEVRFGYVRDGKPRLNRKHITQAVDDSLRRLGTDHIDLYQLHWPDRPTNFFGRLGFDADPNAEQVPLEETLDVLAGLVKAGKLRHIGVSNETAWGVMRLLALAEANGAPRIASIQNPYNLLNRSFEVGLAETALREDCGLLAYSPLAFGKLSGKYMNGARPEGARLTLYSVMARYNKPQGDAATAKYVALARRHGLDPAQMALAWINTRPFLTSNIIGATTMEQLRSNIDSLDVVLPPEVLDGIEAIHREHTYPCP
jgi:aryl-alcohol dehydrogenase-like predicted oxidoreductase